MNNDFTARGDLGNGRPERDRVHTGATRSSARLVMRPSLRKWLRITIVPPGFTTRRISRRTATGSGTAEMV